MKILRSVGLVLALGLTACASTGGGIVPADALNTAKKGLTAGHLAHQGVAVVASGAARSGLCKGACAIQAKDLLDKSEAALNAGDAAIKIGDATTATAELDAANAFIAKIETLTGAH